MLNDDFLLFNSLFSFLEVYQAAMDLYGLIHARFILSPRGLAMMREKFLLGAFGMCQRILCDRQVVLPIGLSEELSTSRVKIFCPRCQEVYVPRQKHLDIDGAYFGISFANILFKTYPDLYPKDGPLTYQPLIFGFKIFGQRGSAYEERFDNSGQPSNKSAADVLAEIKLMEQQKNKQQMGAAQAAIGNTPNGGAQPMEFMSAQAEATATAQMQQQFAR